MRGNFFNLNCSSFLTVSDLYANVAMQNGWMHREPFSDEATQPHAWLETPFYGQRHNHLLGFHYGRAHHGPVAVQRGSAGASNPATLGKHLPQLQSCAFVK